MSVNRERKLVPEYQCYFEPECKLIDLLKEVKSLIKEYGPEAYIEGRREDYSESDRLSYRVYIKVPENDAQYEKRIAEEEKWTRYAEEKDKADFERLQKKFGVK
jgi:hypothetical protein